MGQTGDDFLGGATNERESPTHICPTSEILDQRNGRLARLAAAKLQRSIAAHEIRDIGWLKLCQCFSASLNCQAVCFQPTDLHCFRYPRDPIRPWNDAFVCGGWHRLAGGSAGWMRNLEIVVGSLIGASMINPMGIELSRELLKEGQPCGGLSS